MLVERAAGGKADHRPDRFVGKGGKARAGGDHEQRGRPRPGSISSQIGADSWSRSGKRRMRLPVAAKIAFISAGAITGTPGSPTPPSGTS